MDARVRKRHVSTVRRVGGYRGMCSWRPVDVMYRLAVNQRVCLKTRRVSMLLLVLWAIPCGTMRAVGCGTWSAVRAGCPPFHFPLFPLSQYAGTYPECSGISAEPRNYLDGSTGRYRSSYRSLTFRTRKKTRLNEKIHHYLEGKNVRRTLHTKRKWQWYKKYSEKSDISKINKRGKGRNTFWLSGRPHIEERLNEGEGPLLQ